MGKIKHLKPFMTPESWKMNKGELKKVHDFHIPALEVFFKLGFKCSECIRLSEEAFKLSVYTTNTIEESALLIGRAVDSFEAGVELGKSNRLRVGNNDFDLIFKHIEKGGMPPTLGYAIDRHTFNIIAEKAAKNIHKWGFDKYIDYMSRWNLKVVNG